MKTKKDQENSVKEVCEFCHTVFIWMQVVVSKMVELDKIKIYPKKEVLNTIHFSFSMKVTVQKLRLLGALKLVTLTLALEFISSVY